MKQYTCPMHPEVVQSKPGRCPKCHMKLVVKGTQETMSHGEDTGLGSLTWKSYLPLIIIIGLILLTSLTITWVDIQQNMFSLPQSISYFMIGFFLVFAGFKLMDLKGFAEGYGTYDLFAMRWEPYGYLYPFIELLFGLGMILFGENSYLLWAEVFIMVFSGIGVARKLLRHEKFQCACLGTFLKVPLTKITLFEDFGMAALALILLLLR